MPMPTTPLHPPAAGPTPDCRRALGTAAALAAAAALLALAACSSSPSKPDAPLPPGRGGVITDAQAHQIQRGMSQEQVRALLGPPDRIVKYPTQSGPTWTYIVSTGLDRKWIDIDFTAAGMLIGFKERMADGPT